MITASTAVKTNIINGMLSNSGEFIIDPAIAILEYKHSQSNSL